MRRATTTPSSGEKLRQPSRAAQSCSTTSVVPQKRACLGSSQRALLFPKTFRLGKKYMYSPAMWPLTCAAAGALCAAVVGVAIKKRGKKRPRDEDVQDAEEQEYQLWAACEVCGRWRMLPKPLEDENAPWDCSVGGWSSGPTCIEKPGAPCRKCAPYEIKASKKAYDARRNARPEIKASKKAYERCSAQLLPLIRA